MIALFVGLQTVAMNAMGWDTARQCPHRQETSAEEPVHENSAENEPANVRYVDGSAYAYLHLKINGKLMTVLVDTGSEMSLVPSSFVNPDEIVGSGQLLRAENGSEIKVLGETKSRCQAGDYVFEVLCLVTDQLSETIFGLEWLEKHQAQ